MELTSEKRAQIVCLKDQGLTIRKIATDLHVSIGAVQKTLSRFNETGSLNSRERSGRPRITSSHTDRLLHRLSAADPFASSSYIRTQIPAEAACSTRTIRRRLKNEFNLSARRPARKPKLSKKNIKDRIAFCKAHQHWTKENWCQVMFSDETSVKQFSSNAQFVRRPPKSRYCSRYVLPKVKQCPSIMIWGAITANGRAGIWIMPADTTINAKTYIEILQEKLPLHLSIQNCSIFQQDGAPCHTAKSVKAWLQSAGITLLEKWPGSSPDLNPIENVWSTMKNKIAAYKPSSLMDLRQKILQVWTQEISSEYCRKLVESMPSRISAVLKANGRHTKY